MIMVLIPHPLMTPIHRILVMPFHEDMIFIVDVLPEPHHCFLWIHLFDVAGALSSPTLNLIPGGSIEGILHPVSRQFAGTRIAR
jgi:hypothetical protein